MDDFDLFMGQLIILSNNIHISSSVSVAPLKVGSLLSRMLPLLLLFEKDGFHVKLPTWRVFYLLY